MTAIEMCYCVLIVSGAFALVALGVFFIRTSVTVRQIGNTIEKAQTTIEKIDRIADDVTYKLDLLNAPVESVARFFDPDKPKFSLLGTILKVFKK